MLQDCFFIVQFNFYLVNQPKLDKIILGIDRFFMLHVLAGVISRVFASALCLIPSIWDFRNRNTIGQIFINKNIDKDSKY